MKYNNIKNHGSVAVLTQRTPDKLNPTPTPAPTPEPKKKKYSKKGYTKHTSKHYYYGHGGS